MVKCAKCGKTVYAMEEQKGIGKSFHKLTCFKCSICNAKIEPGSETEKNGQLSCKNCGNATEGFRGASAANVASFKAVGDVRPSGGVAKVDDSTSPRGGSSGGARFCGKCGEPRTGANEAFCSHCGNKF